MMAKEILISTFQLKCNILTSLPPNSVSIEQMVENWSPAGHSLLLSSHRLNTYTPRGTESEGAPVQLSNLCHQSAAA